MSFISKKEDKKSNDCDDVEIICNPQEMVNQAEELKKLKATLEESNAREKLQALRIEELEKENAEKNENKEKILIYENELR